MGIELKNNLCCRYLIIYLWSSLVWWRYLRQFSCSSSHECDADGWLGWVYSGLMRWPHLGCITWPRHQLAVAAAAASSTSHQHNHAQPRDLVTSPHRHNHGQPRQPRDLHPAAGHQPRPAHHKPGASGRQSSGGVLLCHRPVKKKDFLSDFFFQAPQMNIYRAHNIAIDENVGTFR